MNKPITVVEMLLGVQDDGALIGHPTVLVRTGGCGSRCSWCNSLDAVLPELAHTWTPMSAEDILAEAERLAGGPCLITLTGGDPALQDLEYLILLGQSLGYRFALETQGQVAPEWLELLDFLTVSPKPPSSGTPTDWKVLHEVIGAGLAGKPRLSLKIVVMDDADFAYAEMIQELFPPVDLYVVAGNASPARSDGTGAFDFYGLMARATWLAEKVIERKHPDMRVSLPMGALLWGNARAA
jgi:7-carboxy-7-deazaguanine synthase